MRAAFRSQARACARLGSPLMERLLHGLAGSLQPGTPLTDRILTWPGDPGPAGDALPLRLAAGLHALVLSGTAPALAKAYAAGTPLPAALDALQTHAAQLDRWLDHPPQTNELRRSAPLLAAGHLLTARFGLPLALSELGASAGLNLLWDRCTLTLPGLTLGTGPIHLAPDWDGPLPPARPITIADRAGCDLHPLDPVTDRLRLLAYLWPDQPDRLSRTEAALREAARLRPPLTQADAADWLDHRLVPPRQGTLHIVFHTIAAQYFPAATRARIAATLAAAGTKVTPTAPLAHLAMEADGTPDGAALTLTTWPGGQTESLGRACFHGRWLRWSPDR
ncbi:DUF2332 domain-containing protein [Tabrizicola sp. TH137]|uniref:DUF2332 domain-containing protein n=1 Tax=Tabrizicola sp. TH137 TaxID=2067452 RepID=UPI00352A46A3